MAAPGVPVLDSAALPVDGAVGMDWFERALSGPGPHDVPVEHVRGFFTAWPVLTARYKPDGDELRMVYANTLAHRALTEGARVLPAGSVLAKIGAHAEPDPLFAGSRVPGRVARVQVMRKDPGNPRARDGWVYGLYMPRRYQGHLTDDEVAACHTCHQAARTRDFVFSRPFPADPGATLEGDATASWFTREPVGALLPALQQVVLRLQPGAQEVMRCAMPVFGGTLFEARELVTERVRATGLTVVLHAPDGTTALVGAPSTGDCVVLESVIPRAPPISVRSCAGKAGQGPQPQ